jgi:hypothetical protein
VNHFRGVLREPEKWDVNHFRGVLREPEKWDVNHFLGVLHKGAGCPVAWARR